MNVLGLSPVVAILVGVRLYRPATRGPVVLVRRRPRRSSGSATCTRIGYPRLFGAEVPFPSIGDGAYVAVYPALMAGLLLLVRRRNPESDRAGADRLADHDPRPRRCSRGSMLIAPYLHEDGLGLSAKLVSIAYPLGDVLLLAAAIRLAVDTGRRQPAFYLLSAEHRRAARSPTSPTAWSRSTGTYDGQVWLDVGWIAFYLLWGAAALHPSMRGPRGGRSRARRRARQRPPRAADLRVADRPGRRAAAGAQARRRRPARDHRRLGVLFGLVVAPHGRASCASTSAPSPASAMLSARRRRARRRHGAAEIYEVAEAARGRWPATARWPGLLPGRATAACASSRDDRDWAAGAEVGRGPARRRPCEEPCRLARRRALAALRLPDTPHAPS